MKPGAGMCLMEYVSLVGGYRFSDRPECTHPALATLARGVNDRVSDRARPWLARLERALRGTNTACPHVAEAVVAACARKGLELAPDDRRLRGILGAARERGSTVVHAGNRCGRAPSGPGGIRAWWSRCRAEYRTEMAIAQALYRIVVATGGPKALDPDRRDAVLIGLLVEVIETHRRNCPELETVDIDLGWPNVLPRPTTRIRPARRPGGCYRPRQASDRLVTERACEPRSFPSTTRS